MADRSSPAVRRSQRLRLALDANQKLLAVGVLLRKHWVTTASSLDLSEAQARVILELDEQQEMPMRTLARCLDYDASNLTNLADRLERQGLIERTSDPADRRVRPVALTDEGRRVRKEFWRRLTGTAGPLTPLDGRQLEALNGLLDAVLEGESD